MGRSQNLTGNPERVNDIVSQVYLRSRDFLVLKSDALCLSLAFLIRDSAVVCVADSVAGCAVSVRKRPLRIRAAACCFLFILTSPACNTVRDALTLEDVSTRSL